MTNFTVSGRHNFTSDKVLPGATIELTGLPQGHAHQFIGIQMFDAVGALVVASAGTVLVEARTLCTLQYEPIPGDPIDAQVPTTSSVAAPLEAIRLTPTALAGITTWRVILYQFNS